MSTVTITSERAKLNSVSRIHFCSIRSQLPMACSFPQLTCTGSNLSVTTCWTTSIPSRGRRRPPQPQTPGQGPLLPPQLPLPPRYSRKLPFPKLCKSSPLAEDSRPAKSSERCLLSGRDRRRSQVPLLCWLPQPGQPLLRSNCIRASRGSRCNSMGLCFARLPCHPPPLLLPSTTSSRTRRGGTSS